MVVIPTISIGLLFWVLKGIMKMIFGVISIFIISQLIIPVLNHFVVIKNTAIFFLTNTGMIGPMTIQFLCIFLATFIYFIIVNSIYRIFIM